MPLRPSGHNDALVVLDTEIAHDKLAALVAVLPHIETEYPLGVEILVENDGVETHVLIDEPLELVGRDFAETFESCYFGVADAV